MRSESFPKVFARWRCILSRSCPAGFWRATSRRRLPWECDGDCDSEGEVVKRSMRIEGLPLIERLHLAEVTRLPDWHPPLRDGRTGYPVFGYLIRHPEGPILVDTGIGIDSGKVHE